MVITYLTHILLGIINVWKVKHASKRYVFDFE